MNAQFFVRVWKPVGLQVVYGRIVRANKIFPEIRSAGSLCLLHFEALKVFSWIMCHGFHQRHMALRAGVKFH